MSHWLFTQWAQVDPAAAAAQAGKSLSGSRSARPEKHRVTLAESDPDSARAWAMSLPESRRKFALAGVLDGVAASGPVDGRIPWRSICPRRGAGRSGGKRGIPLGASDLPSAIPGRKVCRTTTDRQRAIQSISHWWAQFDPAGAAAYADSLPPGNARNSLAGAGRQPVGEYRPPTRPWHGRAPCRGPNAEFRDAKHPPSIGQENPKAAIRPRQSSGLLATQPWIISGLCINGPRRTQPRRLSGQQTCPRDGAKGEVLQQVISGWANSDPSAAAPRSRLSCRPDSSAITRIPPWTSQWAQSDLEGAVAWAKSLPAGSGQRDALRNLGWQLANADPQRRD